MFRALVLSTLTLVLSASAPASRTAGVAALKETITSSATMMRDLEHLTDVVGPRPTGGVALQQAHDYLESRAKEYGLTVLPRESWDCGSTWTPGPTQLHLLTHNRMQLAVSQVGWTPATPGTLKAEVVHLAGTPENALKAAETMAGKIAFLDDIRGGNGDPALRRAQMQKLYSLLKTNAPAALLMSARRSEQRLTTHGGPRIAPFLPEIPTGYLADDHARLLRRLCQRGERVDLALQLGGTLSKTSGTAWNSIIELKGSEKPEEVVLLTAHLDSWHLGQGAVDNGAGCVAILEALRAIKASGLQTKRTIRVAILDGEEIGLLGAKAYVAKHQSTLPQHVAVFNMDIGAGRITGFALQGRDDVKAAATGLFQNLEELGVKEHTLTTSQDSDHAPFAEQGIPTFNTLQAGLESYMTTYHAATDTLDRVVPEDLKQCATVLATAALHLANADTVLPRRTSTNQSQH